ncbi:hypothetical protein EV182_005762, partial [Spiromyces aspiralis]
PSTAAQATIQNKVFIKDAWPHFERDADADPCDEVHLLRTIKAELGHTPGVYLPMIEAGGRVCIRASRTDIIEDTTDRLYEGLPANKVKELPFRAHKRIITTPVGRPLHTLKSVYELIVVLYDAMVCHAQVLSRCGILHRDISENNILAFEDEGGDLHGLLIDYDSAVDTAAEHQAQPDCTGTLPFMSINNLEYSSVKRTALDDWESLIYLICWIGTFGIDGRQNQEDENLPIKGWVESDLGKIAYLKRAHLDTSVIFEFQILDNFHPEVDPEYALFGLALDLHKTLFNNEQCEEAARGTVFKRQKQRQPSLLQRAPRTHQIPASVVPTNNQFAVRVPLAGKLSDELLKVLKSYADEARKLLSQQSEPEVPAT